MIAPTDPRAYLWPDLTLRADLDNEIDHILTALCHAANHDGRGGRASDYQDCGKR